MSRYVKDSNGNWNLSAGLPQIDNELDSTSENPVQNKAIVEGMSPILNVLGAKNLLLNAATTQVKSGITFTIYSDGSVKANGTASDNIWFVLTADDKNVNLPLEHGKDYILSGCPSGGSNDNYYLYVEQYYDGAYQTNKDYGNGVQFTGHSRTKDAVVIYVKSGTVMSNLMFYPMIRPASVADDTYVPYAMTNRELSNAFGVNTGVSGLYAYKMGRVVMLSIVLPAVSNTSGGWKSIVTLPRELAPLNGALLFSLYDNSANTQASSMVVPAQISTSNILNIYLFGDKLTVTPRGVVTYISKY